MPINNDIYLWFSGATDITGKALIKELNIDGGKIKPTNAKTIIGWGTKIDENITFAKNINIINHPNNILLNRNKLRALDKLRIGGAPIAKYMEGVQVTQEDLPVIGRTNWHQGGKGFWICPTMTLVKNAIKEGANYFQHFIEIKDEYRLHVVDEKVIYGVKKVKRNNMSEAFVAQNKEKIESIAAKNDKKLEKDTVDYVLKQMAKEHKVPDMIIRSNTKGWKFTHITNIIPELKEAAIKATKILGLDFAAVDCCVDVKDNIYIIELNSGPGLKGETFSVYIAAFKAIIDKNKIAKKTMTVKSVINKKKETLKSKAVLMTEMIDCANEKEAAALESIFAKMFAE